MSEESAGVVPPPPGVTPDFDSIPWLRNANQIAVAVGVTLCTLSLMMRLYTKACIMRKFWWDDMLITIAWAFVIGTQAVILYGYANSGFAIHIWNLTAPLLIAYRKTLLAFAVLYIVALALAKLAITMLYYRLLQTVRVWKYILWVLGSCICITSTALVLAIITACNPIQEGWSLSGPTTACRRRSGIHLGTAIANVTSDVMLILVPIVSLWSLQIPLLQKIGVICLCGIGCFTVIISIVRLATLIPFLESRDQPHQIGLACLLIVIEVNLVILCGSLSYLRQFLRYHAPRIMQRDEHHLGHHILSTHSAHARTTPKSQHIGLRMVHDDVERATNESCDDPSFGVNRSSEPVMRAI